MSTTQNTDLPDAQFPAAIGSAVTQASKQEPEPQLEVFKAPPQQIYLQEDPSSTSLLPQPHQPKLCGVCIQSESKYKCTRCELPYCSVACSKLHKETHANDVETESPAKPKLEQPAPVTTAQPGTMAAKGLQNPFLVLETSQDLQTLFMMFPRLRSQLRDIHAQTQAPTDDSLAHDNHMDVHQSFRGRGSGRGRGGRGRGRGPWTPERGTQDGLAALRRAQQEYGKGGEGVREFEQLVLKLVTTHGQLHDGIDAAAIVQREVAEENARIISQLLNGEDY